MTHGEEGPPPSDAPAKRPYVPPALEKLGTIRELTHGVGMTAQFDSTTPPGQNKSRL